MSFDLLQPARESHRCPLFTLSATGVFVHTKRPPREAGVFGPLGPLAKIQFSKNLQVKIFFK